MKKILFLSAILQTLFVSAQKFEWLKCTEAPNVAGTTYNTQVSVDASGYIYVLGAYGGQLIFGDDTLSNYGGAYDLFLSKMDSSGNIIWTYPVGSDGNDEPVDMAIDGASNIYLSTYGYFLSNIYLHDTTITPGSWNNLLCLDTSGSFQWINTALPTTYKLAASTTAPGVYAIYISTVLKLDDQGNTIWQKTATHIGLNNAEVKTIGMNDHGRLAVTFWPSLSGSGTVTLDSVTVLVSDAATNHIVFVMDTSGSALWGAEFTGGSDPVFRITSVAVSNLSNDVYVGAEGGNNILYFANDTIVNPVAPIKDWGVVLKFSSTGAQVWARAYYAGDQGSNAHLRDLTINAADEIVFCGDFANTVQCTFGPFSLPASGVNSIVGKLSASGAYMWAKMDPRNPQFNDYAYHLACVNSNKYVVGGLVWAYPPIYAGCYSFIPTIAGNYLHYFTMISDSTEPSAAFTYSNVGLTFTFTDQSVGAWAWDWDFGDGDTSTLQNPVHTYLTTGNHVVTLYINDSLCASSGQTSLDTIDVGMDDNIIPLNGIFITNPFTNLLEVRIAAGSIDYSIRDVAGKLIVEGTLNGSVASHRIETTSLIPGVYFVTVTNNSFRRTLKAVKMY